MLLKTDKEAEFLSPDGDTIEKVIRGLLLDPDESFSVLESDPHNFIQTVPASTSTFYVEYRAEGQNYIMESVPIETVIRLFQSFSMGEASWKNSYPWIEKPPDSERPLTAILEHLGEETGRSLDEWVRLIRQSGLQRRALRNWLRTEHQL